MQHQPLWNILDKKKKISERKDRILFLYVCRSSQKNVTVTIQDLYTILIEEGKREKSTYGKRYDF